MSEQPRHEMQFQTKYSSGAELWLCPSCGRQFLLSYPPGYKKIILDPGDESAIHSGGKGGLRIGPIQIGRPNEPALPEEIVATLEKILKDFDLDYPSDTSDSHT